MASQQARANRPAAGNAGRWQERGAVYFSINNHFVKKLSRLWHKFVISFTSFMLSRIIKGGFRLTKTLVPARLLATDKPAYGKIIVLGNSITRHPPLAEIHWPHNWGMAATSQDKDFVHLL
ncbi:hypothetical protein [Hymenobacter cheonanensis]|uniref:hypothetical protein n=1 Tax=Hymenobacter sp. CA2-7 TaxID=3063993 RepID=UPI0027125689|nr:hypothetical protein [Hymenobacter sp. CA2-7]MDO7885314.1 hypothetical protein [Hymenobacter sp. CA2-7]